MDVWQMGIRESDSYGSGHFGASRGGRTHKGVDLICPAGELVGAPVDGVVTKLGYPYAKHLEYRYVEITNNGYAFRVFYVLPTVQVGDKVKTGDIIGESQDLQPLYPGITDHIHFEIKGPKGQHIDPTPVVAAMWGMVRHGASA